MRVKLVRARSTIAAVFLAVLALVGATVTGIGQPLEISINRATGSLPPARDDQIGSVLALGDSVPAGAECECADYITLVAQGIAAHQGVAVSSVNASVPGQTSGELIDELSHPAVMDAISQADLVVVEIGANDFDPDLLDPDSEIDPAEVYSDTLGSLKDNLSTIVSTLRTVHGSPVQVVLVGYWNNFEAGQVGDEYGSAYETNAIAVTDASNAVISAAAADSGAAYVDLVNAFFNATDDITTLLEDDGDHPNAAGHEVIAAAVEAAVY